MGYVVQKNWGCGLKVTHVIVGLGVGGAELMLMRLIASHRANPIWQHRVIALTSLGVVGQKLRAEGVQVDVMNMRSPLNFGATLWRVMLMLRQQRPDVVQTWMYHADLLGGLAARMAGIKSVIWGVRTTDISTGGARATGWVRWLCARLSRWVPHTIVCAAEASRQLHVALGYNENRMVVVPNGFDLSSLQVTPLQVNALRSECGFSENTVVVGTLGRFNPVKDPGNFVRAAGILAKKKSNVRFLMVGRDCDYKNIELVSWIKATENEDRFVLLGERGDAASCLAAMDVFCLPSRTEGFPNVVGEAMAMRRVCVVTDVGDAAYLLGEGGVVVPKGDSSALAEGMEKLVELSHADREILGSKMHSRILAEFTMDRARERFEKIYVNVCAGDSSSRL